MKIIAIGGVPASGKSTLLKNIRKNLGERKYFKFGMLKGEFYPNNVFIFGTYGAKFGGTDTLSMAVQPIAEKFLDRMIDKDYTIIFEGDRLFNKSYLKYILDKGIEHKFYLLTADRRTIDQRHIDRNDTQAKGWIKGRETKYRTLYAMYVSEIEQLTNSNDNDLKNNVTKIMKDING